MRPANSDDVAAMAASLALAFHDDPVMGWLFGDRPPRPVRYLEPFLAHEGHRHLRNGHVFTLDDHAAAAYWDPPGRWKTSPWSIVRLIPLMLRGMGGRAVPALRGLARVEKVHEQRPEHFYLAVLGTRPDRQGQGLGAALVDPILARCDAEGTGAYLESSKESNIPYYRRFGFDVVDEVTFPGGPTIWPMWRDPQPPSSAP